MERLQIRLKGLLQGIGFRPYVYRLAVRHKLTGWVANDHGGVVIELEGETGQQQKFITALHQHLPAGGFIEETLISTIPRQYDKWFQLKTSLNNAREVSAFVCPDIAPCKDCLTELFNPDNRRFLHPFISCCHCGPRFSVITALPYDRCNTTFDRFTLCATCLSEYQNPMDRRFHAQTIACPDCGPQLSFFDDNGSLIISGQAALEQAGIALKRGKIIAVKGVGGFQLMLDANNRSAVSALRQTKQRPEKPFALMASSIHQARQLCVLTPEEEKQLLSSAAPIILAQAKPELAIAPAVAPNQALLGIMLPSSALHHLIAKQFSAPLVVTSGNRNGEPICIDNQQAFEALSGIADYFLSHDRDILRPLDDSIVRVIANKTTVLRRARGYVPTPMTLNKSISPTLALGGQLKNTVAIANKDQVILSQHLGDLERTETRRQFFQTIDDLTKLYNIQPVQVVCDSHPDYSNSQDAGHFNLPVYPVQHHYAHILSCMAEHQLSAPLLGVAWDGIGLGADGQLWGGEFLLIGDSGFERVACLRPFPLPGAVQAVKEPRRAALGLLYAALGERLFLPEHEALLAAFTTNELKLLPTMLQKKLNCPETTSIGRLFDAFAGILGLCQYNRYEGQAAMAMEQAAARHSQICRPYALSVLPGTPMLVDWLPMLQGVLTDMGCLTTQAIAAKIHYSLAQLPFIIAEKIGQSRLALSGGCFQNAFLVEAIESLNLNYHYTLYRQQKIPPNDAGLALGQIFATTLNQS